jgi:uncharacterized damage-inducible protein DinB
MEIALDQIVEAWRPNNRINVYLIDRISAEGMLCTLSKRGGRNVVRQFAHVHNNRVWQLEKRASDLAAGLHKFETADEPGRDFLKEALAASTEAVETFFREAAEGLPKRRTFKRGLVQHLSYLVSHESHHRGNILLTLKQCGHGLPSKHTYAIWNWDRL